LLEKVARAVSHSRLGAAIGDELKAERRAIKMTRLLRVADVELDVVSPVDREGVVRGLSGGQGLRCHAIVLSGAGSVLQVVHRGSKAKSNPRPRTRRARDTSWLGST